MNPSIFEVIMLICFGAAWPFSIYSMIKTKKSHGKSVHFLVIVIIGYLSGMCFQYFGNRNAVIFLYAFNAFMVTVDLVLTLRYRQRTESIETDPGLPQ